MKRSLLIHARAGRPCAAWLGRMIRRAWALEDPPLRRLSLALVGDAEMARLHEQFMGLPGPTDVLTFELEHDAEGAPTEGEVVVCVPHARRQARLRGIELRRELLLYSLHGMLHLSGYDDRARRDFETMHRREDQLLTRLGIGPVFKTPAGNQR